MNAAATSDLPSPSTGASRYLDEVLAMFVRDFGADRAALYLYDEKDGRFTMRSASGFPMFGQATISLKLGEGLVGRSLAERRPIYSEMASSMRGYIAHPNFPDGDTQTFLALPLLRGRERVGAVALYRRTGHPFLAEEISGARMKADEVAAAVQNAGALLMAAISASVPGGAASRSVLLPSEQMLFRGSAVSNGWAMGPLRVMRPRSISGQAASSPLPPAIRGLDEAVSIVEESLRRLAADFDRRLPEAASLILDADVMMLHDENFAGRIKSLSESGTPVPEAVARVASDYIAVFEASDNEYMREKARDVEDLALRLLDAATQPDASKADSGRDGAIVVAEKMLPSDVLRAARDRASGIVLCAGGATAHVSLLVRSLRLPTMIVKSRDLLRLPDGERAILDCANETLYVHPDEPVAAKFANRVWDETADRRIGINMPERTLTRDGTEVALEANVNILSDVSAAVAVKAAGIGLYRTEFPFLMRQSLPGEADQLAIYERILRGMPDKPVTFRTLDAGSDKMLPYVDAEREDNPALGLRSIRFSLKYPDILDQQLRAILRAVQRTGRDDVSVMFPMVSSVEEFRAAREHVETCLAALQAETKDGAPLHVPFVGTMVEVPAAIAVADALAEESDFFSVGTNDLIQYTLAVDRTNAAVSASYVPHHPAVLRALRLAAGAARRHGIPCAICGEMGRDPKYLPFLLGVGMRTFSLEPQQIPNCRELVSRLDLGECEKHAARLLAFSSISEIEAEIDDFSKKTFG